MTGLQAALPREMYVDADSFARLDSLRRRFFPPERNVLSAHLTLFHALPGGGEAEIRAALAALCGETDILPLAFSGVRSLGRGAVGIPGRAYLAAAPLPPGFRGRLAQNRARFPLGVDHLLTAPGLVAGLPRGTRIPGEG